MKIKITTISIFFPLLILIAGCRDEKEVGETVYKVQVERIVPYDGLITSSYTGVVEEKQKTPLSFLTIGTIQKIYVHEGQQIHQGMLIASIDASSSKNYYEMALAQEQKAQDAYNRFKPLYEKGTIPQIQMVEIQTALNQAKSNCEIAKKNMNDNNLYTPFGGTIGKIHLTQGMNTAPGVSVVDLLDINAIFVKISVPEDEISRFEKGVKAQVSIPAISEKRVGVVTEIGVTADLISHTYSVKIEINNSELSVKPGMVCTAMVDGESNKTGFLISARALQKDLSGNQYLFVVDPKNRVSKILVQTIALVDDKVLVSGNLTRDAYVVVAGQEKLKPNVKVSITQ